jgi:enterochelin esterase family protein
MKIQRMSLAVGILLAASNVFGQGQDCFYKLGPDSLVMEGVPQGKLVGPHKHCPCEAYPGTQHTYSVFVPAQYDPAKPASLMVFQDGHAFFDPNGSVRAPNVLEQLDLSARAPGDAGRVHQSWPPARSA